MSRSIRRSISIPLLCLFAAACGDDDDYGGAPLAALDAEVVAPDDNPISDEKSRLGRLLFFDSVLSASEAVACATCHHPAFAYADGRGLSAGFGGTGLGPDRQPGTQFPHVGRNAPTVLNVAFNGLMSADGIVQPDQAPMFWDSRIRGLEAQVLEPIITPSEMAGSGITAEDALANAVARVAAIPEYAQLFASAFGSPGVDAERLAKALATYVRSLVTRDSPFDRFQRGDQNALDAEAQQGLEVFERIGCATCHGGPMLSNWSLHVLGVAEHPSRAAPDEGAGAFRFRTPSLRNVALTAPYMHNGTQATLDEVVDFYLDARSLHPQVSGIDIAPQTVTPAERLALLRFLESLTDEGFSRAVPAAVPSGLPVPQVAPGGS